MPAGEKIAAVEAMQQAAQNVELLLQYRIGFMGIHGRPSLALAAGVLLERGFQLIGDTDVVHHQTALLVLEHAVNSGNGLHQVVAFHGFVHVQGVNARRIETG